MNSSIRFRGSCGPAGQHVSDTSLLVSNLYDQCSPALPCACACEHRLAASTDHGGGAVPRNWTANRNKRYARNVASDRLGSCTLSVPALISSTSAVFQLQVVESDSPSHAGSSEQPSIYKGKVDPQRDHDQRLQPTHESN